VLFLEEAKDVESPKFMHHHSIEIPLTSGGDSLVPCSPASKMSPFHVIFNLNGILITTDFDKGGYGKATSRTAILRPRLKEFLEICLSQFVTYIWFAT